MRLLAMDQEEKSRRAGAGRAEGKRDLWSVDRYCSRAPGLGRAAPHSGRRLPGALRVHTPPPRRMRPIFGPMRSGPQRQEAQREGRRQTRLTVAKGEKTPRTAAPRQRPRPPRPRRRRAPALPPATAAGGSQRSAAGAAGMCESKNVRLPPRPERPDEIAHTDARKTVGGEYGYCAFSSPGRTRARPGRNAGTVDLRANQGAARWVVRPLRRAAVSHAATSASASTARLGEEHEHVIGMVDRPRRPGQRPAGTAFKCRRARFRLVTRLPRNHFKNRAATSSSNPPIHQSAAGGQFGRTRPRGSPSGPPLPPGGGGVLKKDKPRQAEEAPSRACANCGAARAFGFSDF